MSEKEQVALDEIVDAFLKIEGRALRLQMGCKETIAEFQTFSMGYLAGYEAAVAAERERPVDMLLYCPVCFEQHVDRAEPDVCQDCGHRKREHIQENGQSISVCFAETCSCQDFTAWLNPPHKSHRCGVCNHVWRPADVPTNGVLTLETRGKADGLARPIAFANGADFTAALAALRERIIAELEDIMQGGDEWRRYDEALREAVKIVKGGDER